MVCTGPLKAARWECAQPHTFSHTVHHHTHALTLSYPVIPGWHPHSRPSSASLYIPAPGNEQRS